MEKNLLEEGKEWLGSSKQYNLESKDFDVNRIKQIYNLLTNSDIAFPKRSFYEILKRGFQKERDPPGMVLMFLRITFTIVLIALLPIQSSCSSDSDLSGFCNPQLFLSIIIVCGVFTGLSLLYAFFFAPFYTDYWWRRDRHSPHGIADVKGYILDLCRAAPILRYSVHFYDYKTRYRTVTQGEESKEVPYEVRVEGETKSKLFEYTHYTDISQLPPIEELTRSPLLFFAVYTQFEFEPNSALSKRFAAEKDAFTKEVTKNKSHFNNGESITLPDFTHFQTDKLCTFDESKLPWCVKNANVVYLILALFGLQWFFAIWMQGSASYVSFHVKKRLID